ncbi:MAG: hypothetical protein AB8I69_23785 [Anaerolineae bacterium]|jgi:hypothetical protein
MTDLQATILHFIRDRSGLSAPGAYQFEDLHIDIDEEHPDRSRTLRFRYFFDEDGFSQYDKTIGLEGHVTIDAEQHILVLASSLKITHIGVAAHYKPPTDLVNEQPAG